jgi:hypothetical protein
LWTGNDASPRAFTLDGDEDMQPDFCWSKSKGLVKKSFKIIK